jgi:hypothetical protein
LRYVYETRINTGHFANRSNRPADAAQFADRLPDQCSTSSKTHSIFESHFIFESRSNTMAKGMTKTALVRALAEKLELTNKQTTSFL